MNVQFFTSEWKKWIRDPMMVFMLFYPLLFGALGRWGLPWLAEESGFFLDPFLPLIMAILAIIAPHIYGSIAGFSILDDRDDNIFQSVQVSPLSISGFLAFRLVLVTIMSFGTSIFVLVFSNLSGLPWSLILWVSFLASLIAPMCALAINALASNKVEGFVVLKGLLGLALVLPGFGLFFHDAKELFFGLAPGFWPAKMISGHLQGSASLFLAQGLYFWIGLVYIGILSIGCTLWFRRRVLQ